MPIGVHISTFFWERHIYPRVEVLVVALLFGSFALLSFVEGGEAWSFSDQYSTSCIYPSIILMFEPWNYRS